MAAKLANEGDTFVDGAVLAAARTLPTWSEGDTPAIPSLEIKAVKTLQEECKQFLAEYSTTSKQDQHILGKNFIGLFAPLILLNFHGTFFTI